MQPERLADILRRVEAGQLPAAAALAQLAHLGYDDLDFAKLDHHRHLRCGFPEVVFGAGKSDEQVLAIAAALLERGENLFVTRLRPETAAALRHRYPQAEHDALAQCLSCCPHPTAPRPGHIGILSAGSSDAPVAREAWQTLRFFGHSPELIQDVGVAGLHRLLAQAPRLRELQVLIVVAGMEGALPSVVAGLLPLPVVAVPTSVGYGASFGGIAALLGMLNSCASGVTVCNIDNGFGAACAAARICRLLPSPE